VGGTTGTLSLVHPGVVASWECGKVCSPPTPIVGMIDGSPQGSRDGNPQGVAGYILRLVHCSQSREELKRLEKRERNGIDEKEREARGEKLEEAVSS